MDWQAPTTFERQAAAAELWMELTGRSKLANTLVADEAMEKWANVMRVGQELAEGGVKALTGSAKKVPAIRSMPAANRSPVGPSGKPRRPPGRRGRGARATVPAHPAVPPQPGIRGAPPPKGPVGQTPLQQAAGGSARSAPTLRPAPAAPAPAPAPREAPALTPHTISTHRNVDRVAARVRARVAAKQPAAAPKPQRRTLHDVKKQGPSQNAVARAKAEGASAERSRAATARLKQRVQAVQSRKAAPAQPVAWAGAGKGSPSTDAVVPSMARPTTPAGAPPPAAKSTRSPTIQETIRQKPATPTQQSAQKTPETTTPAEGATPKTEGATPKTEGATPKTEGATPKGEAEPSMGDRANQADSWLGRRVDDLVGDNRGMEELRAKLQTAKTPKAKAEIQQQIEAANRARGLTRGVAGTAAVGGVGSFLLSDKQGSAKLKGGLTGAALLGTGMGLSSYRNFRPGRTGRSRAQLEREHQLAQIDEFMSDPSTQSLPAVHQMREKYHRLMADMEREGAKSPASMAAARSVPGLLTGAYLGAKFGPKLLK